jgi:hypothetical protein
MIYRRTFIAAMKRNNFLYNSKTKIMRRTYLDSIGDGIDVRIYLQNDTVLSKEYVDIRIQTYEFIDKMCNVILLDERKRIPYEHVMLELALIKDIRKWWAA